MRPTYVKSCENCGKQFESTSFHARYCSCHCSNKARAGRRRELKKEQMCPHNNYVTCNNHECGSCGWNPEVAQKRMDKVLGGV